MSEAEIEKRLSDLKQIAEHRMGKKTATKKSPAKSATTETEAKKASYLDVLRRFYPSITSPEQGAQLMETSRRPAIVAAEAIAAGADPDEALAGMIDKKVSDLRGDVLALADHLKEQAEVARRREATLENIDKELGALKVRRSEADEKLSLAAQRFDQAFAERLKVRDEISTLESKKASLGGGHLPARENAIHMRTKLIYVIKRECPSIWKLFRFYVG